MTTTLLPLVSGHAPVLVAMAVFFCLIGSWLLVGLLRRAERTDGMNSLWWLVWSASVAGLTVWTTHFIAMIGYRTDLLLSYGLGTTALSILIGIVAVGVPLALSTKTAKPEHRTALGAFAGLGIGAMHFTGMAALHGCTQTQSMLAGALGCLGGASCYALARSLPRDKRHGIWAAGLFALGVLLTHFIAIAGVTLTPIPAFSAEPFHKTVLVALTAAGAIILFTGAFLSLLASRRFRAQERAHSAVLATALDNMSNGLAFISEDQTLRLFNQRFMDIFNLPIGSLRREMPTAEFLETIAHFNNWSVAERGEIARRFRKRSTSGMQMTTEFGFPDGRLIEVKSGPVEDGMVMTFEDITEERRAQSRISHMAYHDPLTGLPNRGALEERMEEGFNPKRRYKLLLADLDRFKAVNDTYGHKIGDQLLIDVAHRMREVLGDAGFIARVGGDEMAVLVYGDFDQSWAVANDIIAALKRPFLLNGTTLSIGCSIGMCCTDDARTVQELMQHADIALYESKRHGRGRTSCYKAGMLEAVAERQQLESDIHQALEQNQFHLEYQPVMQLSDNSIAGYEALIRWDHPTRGRVPPVVFIPVAEETGQIMAIGKWVLEEACREAASWPRGLHVAVNVSPAQFKSPKLCAEVVAALNRSGLPANRLEIELTETALVEDGKALATILGDLRSLGIKVAMDDFGTGYSSLAHIRDFPIDRIKIDRSFVMSAHNDSQSLAVLKAITQMGRDMGIPTLAEGIETQDQLDLLRSLGCEAVQGYLIGKPARINNNRHESVGLKIAS